MKGLIHTREFTDGLDADSDFAKVSPGAWVNAENIRMFTTNTGATNRAQSIGGNVLLTNPYLPAGTNLTIGGVEDDAGDRLFYLNWNSNGDHAIYCYDHFNNIFYKVLLNAQVTGGLNFSKYHLAHSVKYVDNKLYWVEAFWNEPRRINTEAGIKLNHAGYSTTVLPYTDPLPKWAITIIRRSSYFPPIALKTLDGSYANNFLSDQATQYAFRYLFRDYEYSVIGDYSALVPFNNISETFNRVEITMPAQEFIDQDILEVELIVKFGNTGKPARIHTWTKTDIDAHNTGTPLLFNFYNDIIGVSISDVDAVKPFESIPLLCETLERAKNRNFLGNVNEGYDTPATSSLTTSVSQVDSGGGTITGVWYTITFTYRDPMGANHSVTFYYFYVSAITLSYLYFNTIVPPQATVSVTDPDLNYQSATVDGIIAHLSDQLYSTVAEYIYGYDIALQGTTSTVTSTTPVVGGRRAFKSNGTYMVAVWFFDVYRRKCGVVYVSANKIKMPERTYGQTAFNVGIDWALSNAAALTEIPTWAYYYTVGRTKCLTTDFFLEARAQQSFYAKKLDDGSYTYTTTAYSTANYGVAIDISTIISYGMGYIYNVGDLVNLYFASGPTGTQRMSILAQDGKWLILNLKDLGTLGAAVRPLFEIYTPSKQLLDEPFYEVGNIYPVLNPGTGSRAYSTTTGTLNGDVYMIYREATYYTENMSPNDTVWMKWETDISWPNKIDKIGNVTIPNKICFSDVYLQGTKVNGLSSFGTLNTESVGGDGGKIYKLQLAQKVEEDGSIMLAICQDETFSVYLGEQELYDTKGSAFVAKATGVIGTIKALNGSFGTNNPESVVQYNGKIFWYDSRNSGFIQYADNPLFDLARYRMTRPANLFSLKFRSLSVANIEALGSRPYIAGGYDPHHKELLFSLPATESTPPKGNLSDYSSPNIPYPYDIYNGQEKTWIYKQEKDMWIGSIPIQQEKFIRLGNLLFSCKAGKLYIHNQAQPAFFNGVQYKGRLMYSNNPKGVNQFQAIGLNGNKKPTFVHFRTEDPFVQSSGLDNTDFGDKEGMQYASLQRDRLSPNSTGNFNAKEKTGDKLFGKALLVMLEYDFADTIPLELKEGKVQYKINSGHL